MFYLENCQPVVPYQAEEFSGDSVLNNGLEIQQAFSDNPFDGGENQPGIYYLVVEAMPGFNIQASMIQIGGLSGFAGQDTVSWSSLYGNNSVLPSELNQDVGIQAKDSIPNTPYYCGNKVFIRVVLALDFVMPSNDVTINIDLGGGAVQCQNNVLALEDSYLDFLLILGNGVNANPACPLFVAKYYENQNQATSPHDAYNQESEDIYGQSGGSPYNSNGSITWTSGIMPPNCDPDGSWTALLNNNNFYSDADYFTGEALQNFQPTFFCEYKHTDLTGAQLWNPLNIINIASECGQLIYRQNNHSAADDATIPVEHPNYDENPVWHSTIKRMDYRYVFPGGQVGGPPNLLFNSQTVPYVEPGESYPPNAPPYGNLPNLIPSALRWYISVGNNSHYELLPENVDVYKIISAKGYYTPEYYTFGTNAVDPNFSNCPIPGQGYEQILISEKTNGVTIENNSNLNIDNITCVSVAGSNNKTVMLTVNFQSGYLENIWTQTANVGLFGSTITPNIISNQHRIFANVYPSEVTANP